MGADIHSRVIVRNKEKWDAILIPNTASKWRYSLNEDPDRVFSDESGNPYVELYDGRDYELFGILAGVRSNIYDQIDDTRGTPDFAPDIIKEFMSHEYFHSQTYYYLSELKLWLKDKKHFKYLSKDFFDELDEDEQKRVKEEYKSMRKRFEYFVWCVEKTASLAGYYGDEDVVVCMAFDS